MNERLKELYSDSVIYAFDQRFIPGPVRELQEVITEKFAELIVKECIEVVSKSCASPTGAQALMGHFGVER